MRKTETEIPKFSIWPVLEHYGWELPAPRGGFQSVKCSKHGDTHNSASVSEESNYVFCHACDFKGDAIDVVMAYEGIGFKDAVRRCEEIAGGGATMGDKLRSGGRDKRGGRSYKPPRLRR